MNYLAYFFNPSHLFSLRPQAMNDQAALILAGIFAVLIVLAIVARLQAKKMKDGLKVKGFKRLFQLFLTTGILGFVYLFFGWQGVILLGSRFWLLILLAVFIVWLAYILRYLYIEVPKKRAEINKKRKFEAYLP